MSEPEDLYDLAESVHSKETFLQFVLVLAKDAAKDRRQSQEQRPPREWSDEGPLGWRHSTIDGFLGAMGSWAEGTSALTGEPSIEESPSWRDFARALLAGKVYE